jgi:hypothetical protein
MASSPKFYDRVLMSSTTTGTGTLTLGSAITGYQAWSVLGNGNSAYYYIEGVDGSGVPSGEWEVGIGTYTTSGTTLSRDSILASSNSGSVVSLSAGTKRVALIGAPAAVSTTDISDMGGRLTLTTGVPVTTSDVATATTLYYTPYKHNRVELWNGSGWVRYTFSEISLVTPSLTNAKPYDIWLYDNAGTLTLEALVWTDASTRATAIVQQDGVWCKTGALTRRLVGTIYPSATDTMTDTLAFRGVSNVDNAVPRPIYLNPGYANDNTTTSYTNNSTTWGLANGGTGATATYVLTLPSGFAVTYSCIAQGTATQPVFGIGDGSTSQAVVLGLCPLNAAGQAYSQAITWSASKAAGASTIVMLIASIVNAQTATFYADLGRFGGAAADQAGTTLTATVQG